MKTHEIHADSARPIRAKGSSRRQEGKISAGPALLGVVCVIGVFALLWVFYTYG